MLETILQSQGSLRNSTLVFVQVINTQLSNLRLEARFMLPISCGLLPSYKIPAVFHWPNVVRRLQHRSSMEPQLNMIKALKGSSPAVLITRMLIAAVVVFATYNPTGVSVFHWVTQNKNPSDAWVILGAIVAILANVALLIAAWKALGKIGTIIVVIFFAALVYLSLQEGWVSAGNQVSMEWLALILYSAFLGIGLSGAIIWRRATGQVVTDEADDLDH